MIRWETSSEWASTATWPSTRPAPPMASGTVPQRFADKITCWAQLQQIFDRRRRCRRCRWRSRSCRRRWGAWRGRWKEFYKIQNTKYKIQNTKYKIQNTTWLIADRADKVEVGPCKEGGRCQGCPSSEKVQHSCNLPFPQILPFTFLPFCSGLALRWMNWRETTTSWRLK